MWQHRRRLLELLWGAMAAGEGFPLPLLEEELAWVGGCLREGGGEAVGDAKNHHAWTHKLWVLARGRRRTTAGAHVAGPDPSGQVGGVLQEEGGGGGRGSVTVVVVVGGCCGGGGRGGLAVTREEEGRRRRRGCRCWIGRWSGWWVC